MIVNMEELAVTTGINDIELLKSFVGDFFKICSKDLERITVSIEKGDNEAVVRHSHNIYGAAYRLRLAEIREAAATLGKAAANMETEKYGKLYGELKDVFLTGSEEYKKIA